MTSRGWLLFAAMAMIWGIPYLLIKVAVAELAPVTLASLALTALAFAPLGIAQLPAALPSTRVLLSVGVLGVVCIALAFLLFFALITEVGPIRATIITYFNPAVALALGVLLLNEPFTVGLAAGFALIAIGSFSATRRARGMPRPSGALPEGAR